MTLIFIEENLIKIMFVCICWFDIFLQEQPNSLKGKRHFVKSIKDKIWNKFHVSIAEVGKNDLWQRLELGISFVSGDQKLCEKMYAQILKILDGNSELEVLDQFYEIQKIK